MLYKPYSRRKRLAVRTICVFMHPHQNEILIIKSMIKSESSNWCVYKKHFYFDQDFNPNAPCPCKYGNSLLSWAASDLQVKIHGSRPYMFHSEGICFSWIDWFSCDRDLFRVCVSAEFHFLVKHCATLEKKWSVVDLHCFSWLSSFNMHVLLMYVRHV